MDLLPPQVYGRSWRGCWLDVQTCLYQLIALLDIDSPSNYFPIPILLIIDLCALHLLDQNSLILKRFRRHFRNFSVAESKPDIDSPTGLCKVAVRVPVL